MPDIFDCLPDLKIPGTVYICGNGPNGTPHLDSIPADAYTIACNGVIEYPRPWSLWMCFDINAITTQWFANGKAKRGVTKLLGHEIAGRRDYSFKYLPALSEYCSLAPGVLRGSATIVGCALQLAYFAGCDEVILNGVDMYGPRNWKGQQIYRHDYGLWPQSAYMQWLIDYCTGEGMNISSLSETRLRLPKAATCGK